MEKIKFNPRRDDYTKADVMKNYYQILEISETSTQDEIRKQYHFLSQAWHPDKFPMPEQKEKAEEKLKDINEAYSILRNQAKRKEYDNHADRQHKQSAQSKTYEEKTRSAASQSVIQTKNNSKMQQITLGIAGIFLCLSLIGFTSIVLLPQLSPLPAKSATPSATAKLNIAPTVTPITSKPYRSIEGMVLVPAGDFTMGRNDGAPNEAPAHLVSLNDFYIDKYEVTNSLYSECVNAGGCKPPTQSASPAHPFYYGNLEFDLYPVMYVTWDMANTFCKWRSARLPTEAEWEKSARGNDLRIYPWGNEFIAGHSNFCDINCSMEWANKDYNDGYADTAPVGFFPQGQSPYGVFDMSGNVYEWVADWFSETSYRSSEKDNPMGPLSGTDRVIRGGAWSDPNTTTITSRASFTPSSAYPYIGFRCAATP